MSDENELSAIHSGDESGNVYETASDGDESSEHDVRTKPASPSKRKRTTTTTTEPRAKTSKNLSGDKLPRNLRYGKTLVWAAVTRTLIEPMVQLDSSVSSPLPVALVHALWEVTTKFMVEHFPGAKFDSPSLPHKLYMVFPGKEIVFRKPVKDNVLAAINAACEEMELTEPRGINRVNMRLRSEAEMRRVLPDSPGHDAMHLLFRGDEELYQQLVTRWWKFISAFEQNLKAE